MQFLMLADLIESEQIVDRCLYAKHSNEFPEVDEAMKGACSVYGQRTCCSRSYSESLQNVEKAYFELHQFNLSHCGSIRNPRCLEWFRRDACAFGCNPYFNLWREKKQNDWRSDKKESFLNVPLCKSDCDQWYNECKNELTCVMEWIKGFKWIRPSDSADRTNKCPRLGKCDTFGNVYGSSKIFCERLWNGMYKVESDEYLRCFHLRYEDNDYPAHAYAVFVNYS
ncbi:hypothetical protein ACOME3_006670 [Neoechinorhynchus agilis]